MVKSYHGCLKKNVATEILLFDFELFISVRFLRGYLLKHLLPKSYRLVSDCKGIILHFLDCSYVAGISSRIVTEKKLTVSQTADCYLCVNESPYVYAVRPSG